MTSQARPLKRWQLPSWSLGLYLEQGPANWGLWAKSSLQAVFSFIFKIFLGVRSGFFICRYIYTYVYI